MAARKPLVLINGATQQLQTTDSLDVDTLLLKGRKITLGNNAPTSPATNDYWVELDSSGLQLFPWWWNWDGTYWKSGEQYWDLSLCNIAGTNGFPLRTDTRFNYYLKRLDITSMVGSSNNSSNYWNFEIQRRKYDDTNTVIATLKTNVQTASQWSDLSSAINTVVTLSSTPVKAFVIAMYQTSSPGSLIYLSSRLTYQLLRA